MARELTIAGRRIADDEPCYVVAEIGHNHGGSVAMALALIESSAVEGVDAVKFQKRTNDTLYTRAMLSQPYAHEQSYGATYGEHRQALELGDDAYRLIQQRARLDGVSWFATAFDEASVDFLSAFNPPAYKIHSGGLTDASLLRYVAACGKPVLVSTGGGTIEDVDRAHDMLGSCPHAFLQCTASYPLDPHDAHLRCIQTMRDRYAETVIGFSSHAPGIVLPLAAYVMGARIIEVHVTLNRAGKGTDHAFSLEPKGLQTLVEDLQNLRHALGDGVKRFLPKEYGPIAKMRRHQTAEGWKIDGALT